MRLYEPPAKEFFRLPNSIFHVPLDATQFKLYAYLVCCSGSKGYCWPTHKKIIQDTSPGQGGHLNCGGRRTPGIEPLRGSLRAAPIA